MPASVIATAPAPARVRVLATTPIVADIAREVVGDAATVELLSAAAVDHGTGGRVVVLASGVGVEAGSPLAPVLDQVRTDGTVVVDLGERLAPQPYSATDARLDPHWWLDVDRVTRAAMLIADATAQATGVDPGPLRARASAYAEQLARLDERIQAGVAEMGDRTRVVAHHDGLGYFAARYGLTLVAVEVRVVGPSGALDPVAAARLAGALADTGSRAVVVATAPADAEQLAARLSELAGAPIRIVVLPTDELGPPGSPTGTYLGLMAGVGAQIVDATRGTTPRGTTPGATPDPT